MDLFLLVSVIPTWFEAKSLTYTRLIQKKINVFVFVKFSSEQMIRLGTIAKLKGSQPA